MYNMYIIFNLFFMISMLIMKINLFLSMKMKLNIEKMSPFECGFNPIYFKRMPFSIRFFLITIVFLIFDIEIALLIPMIFSLNLSNFIEWMMTSTMFLLILLIGLFHEWNYGALNWM